MKKITLFLTLLIFVLFSNTKAQTPICNNSTIIYIHNGGSIYNYDVSLPMSATNPWLNTINNPGGGLAVSNNINGPGPSPTFYTSVSNFYWYYDGAAWVNTGHTCGSAAAVNSGGGGNFIYNLVGFTGEVYKYDGTTNASLLLTVPGFSGGGPYDIVGDCDGGFYILRTQSPNQWMHKIDQTGTIVNTWTVTGPSASAGGGFAIVGDTVYFHNGAGFCKGVMDNITNTINFTVQPTLNPGPSDMAVCPVCGPLPPSGPTADFTFSSDTICEGSCIDLIDASLGNIISYNWSIVGGSPSTSSLQNPTNVCFATPGSYPVQLIVTDSLLMMDTIIKTLEVIAKPEASVTGDFEICYGENTIITAQPAGLNYLWLPSLGTGNSELFLPSTNTTYTLVVNNGYCWDSTTFDIQVNSLPVVTTSSTLTDCNKNTGTTTAYVANGTSPYTFVWSSGDTSQVSTQLGVGTYNVTVTDSKGCTGTANASVGMYPNPTASVSPYPSFSIRVGDEFVMKGGGGKTYVWSPDLWLNCNTCRTPRTQPHSDIVYCVEATDEHGCKDTACLTVFVDTSCANIFIPNAFTPNKDGLNDFIRVENDCITNLKFIIVNRWGQKVFQSTSIYAQWDGTFNGEDQPMATYFYVLEADFTNGRKIRQRGDITLIR